MPPTLLIRPRSLTGAPRRAHILPWSHLFARRAGRHDGPSVEPAADGTFDYNRQFVGRVRLAEARTGQALARAVESMDARIATERADIDALRLRLTALGAPDDVDPADHPLSRAAVWMARSRARDLAEREDIERQIAGHQKVVEHLLVSRVWTHHLAREIVGTHVARYVTLSAAHLRAWRTYRSRSADRPVTESPSAPPEYQPHGLWMTSDLPGPTVSTTGPHAAP